MSKSGLSGSGRTDIKNPNPDTRTPKPEAFMAINVAEITSVLKREIEAYEQKLQISEVGTVIEVGDGIARV